MQFAQTRLTMPVLSIGGEKSLGAVLGATNEAGCAGCDSGRASRYGSLADGGASERNDGRSAEVSLSSYGDRQMLNALTFIHVALSLIGISAGLRRCPRTPVVRPALSRHDAIPDEHGCNRRDGFLLPVSRFLARAGRWCFVVDRCADSQSGRLSPSSRGWLAKERSQSRLLSRSTSTSSSL